MNSILGLCCGLENCRGSPPAPLQGIHTYVYSCGLENCSRPGKDVKFQPSSMGPGRKNVFCSWQSVHQQHGEGKTCGGVGVYALQPVKILYCISFPSVDLERHFVRILYTLIIIIGVVELEFPSGVRSRSPDSFAAFYWEGSCCSSSRVSKSRCLERLEEVLRPCL